MKHKKIGIFKAHNYCQPTCDWPTYLISNKEALLIIKARIEVVCDKPIDRYIIAKHASSIIADILPLLSEKAHAFHIVYMQ